MTLFEHMRKTPGAVLLGSSEKAAQKISPSQQASAAVRLGAIVGLYGDLFTSGEQPKALVCTAKGSLSKGSKFLAIFATKFGIELLEGMPPTAPLAVCISTLYAPPGAFDVFYQRPGQGKVEPHAPSLARVEIGPDGAILRDVAVRESGRGLDITYVGNALRMLQLDARAVAESVAPAIIVDSVLPLPATAALPAAA